MHLPDDHGLAGTIVHNPRSNMNNAVGYARPARFANPVALGTDGIGADMLEEFRLAYARLRESDVLATPDTPWSWLEAGRELGARGGRRPGHVVRRRPWTRGRWPSRPASARSEVEVGGEVVWADGGRPGSTPRRSGPRSAEAARRLWARMEP